jgi:hypothetical protein
MIELETRRPRRSDLGERLQGLVFWLALAAVLALVWIAVPVQAATDGVVAAQAAAAEMPVDERPLRS